MSLLLVSSSETQSVDAKKCRALAMSGGGSFGSYEAGVIYGLYNGAENKEDYQYDVATGVSAGGFNSFGLSLFAKENTGEAV